MTICRGCHSAVQRDITIGDDRAAEFPRTRHLTVEHNSAVILVAVCDLALQDYAFGILDATRIALRLAGIPIERMRTTDSLTKAGQWLDPDAGEQGPTIAYTDADAELSRRGRDHVAPFSAVLIASVPAERYGRAGASSKENT